MHRESIGSAKTPDEARRILQARRDMRLQTPVSPSGAPQVVESVTKNVDLTLTDAGETVSRDVMRVASSEVTPSPMPNGAQSNGGDDDTFMIGGVTFRATTPANPIVVVPSIQEGRTREEELSIVPSVSDTPPLVGTDTTSQISDNSGIQHGELGQQSYIGGVHAATETQDSIGESIPSDMSLPPDAWVGGTTDGLIQEMQVALARKGNITGAQDISPEESMPFSPEEEILPIDILIQGDQMGIIIDPTRTQILDELFFPEAGSGFVAHIDKGRLTAKSGEEKYDSSFIQVHFFHSTEMVELFFRRTDKKLKIKGRQLIFASRDGNRYLISGDYNPVDGIMKFYPSKANTSGPKEAFFGRMIGQPHY